VNILQRINGIGFFHLLGVNFLTQFLGLGGLLLLTAFLSPKELGMAKVIHSYAAIFILIGTFGYNSAILKVCSEGVMSEIQIKQLMASTVKKVLLFSLFSYTLVIFLGFYNLMQISEEVVNWLIVFCIVIPFAAISNIMITYLQSQKKIKLMARTQAVVRSIFFVLVVIATYLYGFIGFIYSSVLSYVAGFLVFLYISELEIKNFRAKFVDKRMNMFALYSFLGAFVSVITQHADIYILESIGEEYNNIGFYSMAILFMMGANQITATTQMIATPYFSERSKDKPWLIKHIIKYQSILIVISILVAMAVFLFVIILVKYIYGGVYLSILEYLPILLIKYVVWSSFAMTGVALLGMGIVKEGTILAAGVAPIGLSISYYLGINYGVIGVAWGQVITSIISLITVSALAVYVICTRFKQTPDIGHQ
jgi:O-antigen/teichoic acid export membrane protein